MIRQTLIEAREKRCWSQYEAAKVIGIDHNTLYRWERGISTPQGANLRRLCEVYGMTATQLLGATKTPMAPLDGQLADVLQATADGLFTCATLSDNGKHDDAQAASQIIASYVPALHMISESSERHRREADSLLSRVFLMKQRLAYHIAGASQALVYAEKATDYARKSEDTTALVISLRELASVHEWPLDHMQPQQRRKKALELTEEAAHILEKQGDAVSPLIQSWVYIGLAKFQALNGLKQEAGQSIGLALDTFDDSLDETIPGLHLSKANLIRQESLVYAYQGDQCKALDTFLQLADINDSQVAAKLPMHARTHLGMLSEATFASLKLPASKKDKELSLHLWQAELQEATALQSKTYLSEVYLAYRIMEALWPDDASVTDLRDLIYWQ